MLEDESPSTQTQLGLVLLALGKYEDALTSLNRAIELDPKFYAAYGNRGIAHSRIGETDLALADYDQEIELNPDYVLAYSVAVPHTCSEASWNWRWLTWTGP